MILDYKGIPVFYTDEGDGAAVVLLHGFLETSEMWRELAQSFKNTHRVITIDLLGHGQTGCVGYIHTMEMMADAVAHVLSHLKVNQAFFIGHSMGGYVALAFAAQNESKILGLCLMNSTPFPDNMERKKNRDRAIKAVKYNHKNFIRMSITNLFGSSNRTRFAAAIESIKEIALQLPLQGIIAALEGMKIRENRSKVLQNLEVPVLVVLGVQDPVLDYEILKQKIGALDVKILELNGGHMSHIENTEELTYNLTRFVEN